MHIRENLTLKKIINSQKKSIILEDLKFFTANKLLWYCHRKRKRKNNFESLIQYNFIIKIRVFSLKYNTKLKIIFVSWGGGERRMNPCIYDSQDIVAHALELDPLEHHIRYVRYKN